jgi:hypothetical protein
MSKTFGVLPDLLKRQFGNAVKVKASNHLGPTCGYQVTLPNKWVVSGWPGNVFQQSQCQFPR